MDEKDDNRDQAGEPLESLLRRWGADEAARQARAADVPQAAPARPARSMRPASWAARWLPLAAGIALGVSGLLGLLAARSQVSDARAEARRLRADRDAARDELRQGRATVADAERRLDETQRRHDAALADLRTQHQAAVAAAEQAAAKREAAINRLVGEHQARAASLTGELNEASRRLAAAKEELRASHTAMERLRESHAAELSRLEAAVDDAATARRRAEDHLVRLQALHETMLPVLAQHYAAGVDMRGEMRLSSAPALAARQSAARRHRLLERAAAVRAGVRDAPSRHLVDTVEVVLTRLDMLDARSATEAGGFARMLARADLMDRIAKALRTERGTPDVRAWLFEAQLLLMGVDDAS